MTQSKIEFTFQTHCKVAKSSAFQDTLLLNVIAQMNPHNNNNFPNMYLGEHQTVETRSSHMNVIRIMTTLIVSICTVDTENPEKCIPNCSGACI